MGYMKFFLCSTIWSLPIFLLWVPSCLHRTFPHAPRLCSNINLCLMITPFITFIIWRHLHLFCIFCIFPTVFIWDIFLRVCYGGLFLRVWSTCPCIWWRAEITNIRGCLGRLWCAEIIDILAILAIIVLPSIGWRWRWVIRGGCWTRLRIMVIAKQILKSLSCWSRYLPNILK